MTKKSVQFLNSNYKNLYLRSAILSLVSIMFYSGLWAQAKNPSPINFPTPKNVENLLFYLQRDPNTNTLIYALNLKENGSINSANPLHIYWIRYAEKGEKKDLGYIQRKFAYGMDVKDLGKDQYELRFVSHKKLPFILKKYSDKSYHASVTVNNKTIRVSRLFVRIEGGSFWLPNVKYAEIEGIEESTGKPITERINVN
ncbi:DUF4833 domain-containing protein [Pedobacter fastidiosus]|uniref:DUF4833 domain-containing protein n=1 Tax=Pedobacter fastidiosus TaxID=2765361 RepID=A0ABR7KTY8_9SPHI|nr:DUF4833 domain-containing protein [Pedobacter fastidiosus]MBC6111290.1 DUF4833 domain-containing protein [Pedobacter fastidiosus]